MVNVTFPYKVSGRSPFILFLYRRCLFWHIWLLIVHGSFVVIVVVVGGGGFAAYVVLLLVLMVLLFMLFCWWWC